jgi:hypothetical protein
LFNSPDVPGGRVEANLAFVDARADLTKLTRAQAFMLWVVMRIVGCSLTMLFAYLVFIILGT